MKPCGGFYRSIDTRLIILLLIIIIIIVVKTNELYLS